MKPVYFGTTNFQITKELLMIAETCTLEQLVRAQLEMSEKGRKALASDPYLINYVADRVRNSHPKRTRDVHNLTQLYTESIQFPPSTYRTHLFSIWKRILSRSRRLWQPKERGQIDPVFFVGIVRSKPCNIHDPLEICIQSPNSYIESDLLGVLRRSNTAFAATEYNVGQLIKHYDTHLTDGSVYEHWEYELLLRQSVIGKIFLSKSCEHGDESSCVDIKVDGQTIHIPQSF